MITTSLASWPWTKAYLSMIADISAEQNLSRVVLGLSYKNFCDASIAVGFRGVYKLNSSST